MNIYEQSHKYKDRYEELEKVLSDPDVFLIPSVLWS